MKSTPPLIRKRESNTKSGRKHRPFFRRVCRAQGYSQACAAVYRLSLELLRIGQSAFTVWHDLSLLVSLTTRALEPALVWEIVLAADLIRSRKGGAQ